MTVSQAKAQVARLRADVKAECKGAAKRTLTKGKNEARRMSSGQLSSAELARRDYPYATRHGSSGLWTAMSGKTPALVNVQTGAFKADWQTDPPQAGDSIISGRLMNLNPVADYLQYGTRNMVARPIKTWMEVYLEKVLQDEVKETARRLERYYS